MWGEAICLDAILIDMKRHCLPLEFYLFLCMCCKHDSLFEKHCIVCIQHMQTITSGSVL